MTTETDNLIKSLEAAAKRHDDALAAYNQASQSLFAEMRQAVDVLRMPGFMGKNLFFTRTELEGNLRALVIQSGLTDKNHTIGTSVLNFQTSGLHYHHSNGQLCGWIEIILSNGDYWKLFKSAKISPLTAMAVSMVSREIFSGMETRSERKLQSIENVSREIVDLLWATAEKPGEWLYRSAEGEPRQLVVKDYIYNLLEAIYNPEYKEWVYKTDEDIQDKDAQNKQ
jgi:hypothetical protein